jgi:hypothetical protein
MIVVPGLSESLGAVSKRIICVDTTDTLLSVEATSSVRGARCPVSERGTMLGVERTCQTLRRQGGCNRRSCPEPRAPFPKESFQSVVEYRATNLQKQMRTVGRPTHGLPFSHSLIYQVIHSRFRRRARYPKAISPGFAVVR